MLTSCRCHLTAGKFSRMSPILDAYVMSSFDSGKFFPYVSTILDAYVMSLLFDGGGNLLYVPLMLDAYVMSLSFDWKKLAVCVTDTRCLHHAIIWHSGNLAVCVTDTRCLHHAIIWHSGNFAVCVTNTGCLLHVAIWQWGSFALTTRNRSFTTNGAQRHLSWSNGGLTNRPGTENWKRWWTSYSDPWPAKMDNKRHLPFSDPTLYSVDIACPDRQRIIVHSGTLCHIVLDVNVVYLIHCVGCPQCCPVLGIPDLLEGFPSLLSLCRITSWNVVSSMISGMQTLPHQAAYLFNTTTLLLEEFSITISRLKDVLKLQIFSHIHQLTQNFKDLFPCAMAKIRQSVNHCWYQGTS